MTRTKKIGTLAVAMLATWATPAAAAAQPACGDVVTADVQLQADLAGCAGHGLVIGAEGVDVDLNGHTISGGPGGGAGIDNSAGHDGVSVFGGTIELFRLGVALTGADDAVLRRLTVSRNGDGVVAAASDRLRVELSSVLSSGHAIRQGEGIVIRDSEDVRVTQVTSAGAEGASLALFDSPRARVEQLATAENGTGLGVYRSPGTLVRGSSMSEGIGVTDSADTRVEDNAITTTFGGIAVTGSSPRTVVAGNDVDGSQSVNVYVAADRVRVEGNRVGSTLEEGILVTGDRVELRENVVSGTFGDGILVTAAATGATLVRNAVSGAFADGIDVDTPSAVLRGNVATENGELGIEGVRGIKSRGWNFASGNGDERQCTFVRCR